MHSHLRARLAFIAILSVVVAPVAIAAPVPVRDMAGEVMNAFDSYPLTDTILEAARGLFWSLATISLVWTMGMLVVRQDIGEVMMELLRFIVVTGIFYWLLINASTRQDGHGFVDDIVKSFLMMINGDPTDDLIQSKANSILARGLHVFYVVMSDTGDGDMADRILTGGIAVTILTVCAVMSAQFVLALVMAWLLGYAGIFLLGFGGARWTSAIAINFYKHVLAVGIVLLALSLVGTVAADFLESVKFDPQSRSLSTYPYLGLMLGVSILMMVLSIKIPQLLYTLVTGSTVGLYAGSASVAGNAIASAGASVLAGVSGHFPGGGGQSSDSARTASTRTESVMDAVHRSASAAGGMSDPFHVGTGSDPFGVARSADPYRSSHGGSVFAVTQTAGSRVSTSTSPVGDKTVLSASATSADNQPNRGQASPTAQSDVPVERVDKAATRYQGAISAITKGAVRPDYEAELGAIEASRSITDDVSTAVAMTSMDSMQSMDGVTGPGPVTDTPYSTSTPRVSAAAGTSTIGDTTPFDPRAMESGSVASVVQVDAPMEGCSHIDTVDSERIARSDTTANFAPAHDFHGKQVVAGPEKQSALDGAPTYDLPLQVHAIRPASDDVAPIDVANTNHSTETRAGDRSVSQGQLATSRAADTPEPFSPGTSAIAHQVTAEDSRGRSGATKDLASGRVESDVRIDEDKISSSVSGDPQHVSHEVPLTQEAAVVARVEQTHGVRDTMQMADTLAQPRVPRSPTAGHVDAGVRRLVDAPTGVGSDEVITKVNVMEGIDLSTPPHEDLHDGTVRAPTATAEAVSLPGQWLDDGGSRIDMHATEPAHVAWMADAGMSAQHIADVSPEAAAGDIVTMAHVGNGEGPGHVTITTPADLPSAQATDGQTRLDLPTSTQDNRVNTNEGVRAPATSATPDARRDTIARSDIASAESGSETRDVILAGAMVPSTPPAGAEPTITNEDPDEADRQPAAERKKRRKRPTASLPPSDAIAPDDNE